MKIKGKVWVGVGVLACVGAALWMRELASWRPVVLKVVAGPGEMRISRDGRFLWVGNPSTGEGRAIDIAFEATASKRESARIFQSIEGLSSYPRVEVVNSKRPLIFSPDRKRQVQLLGAEAVVFQRRGMNSNGICAGWSTEKNEVYGEAGGGIWIWDWNSGKLRKRVRYAQFGNENAVFSPDGKWLLALATKGGRKFLGRFDTQTGMLMQRLLENPQLESIGFSPDGLYFGYTWRDGSRFYSSKIYAINNWKREWEWESREKNIHWVSSSRVGLVRPDHFEWRDTSGEVLQSLPGPFGDISDWVVSPDGKWIYAVEQSGVIRRWRAR